MRVVLEISSSHEEGGVSCCQSGNLSSEIGKTILKKQSRPYRQSRPTINIVIPSLAAAFDWTKFRDRKATYVLADAAQSLSHSVDELKISRSSIIREQEEYQRARRISERNCQEVKRNI